MNIYERIMVRSENLNPGGTFCLVFPNFRIENVK